MQHSIILLVHLESRLDVVLTIQWDAKVAVMYLFFLISISQVPPEQKIKLKICFLNQY